MMTKREEKAMTYKKKHDLYWEAFSRLYSLKACRFKDVDYERLLTLLNSGDIGSDGERLAQMTITELWNEKTSKVFNNEQVLHGKIAETKGHID